MDINIGGITKKLEDNAEWLVLLASAYERLGSIDGIVQQYTTSDVMTEVQRTLTRPALLKHKLLDAPHLYSGVFKISLLGRLLAEMDILPSKYKRLTEKLMLGSAIAAVTLPGSNGSDTRTPSNPNQSNSPQNLNVNVGAY
jgi:hypothetical protein